MPTTTTVLEQLAARGDLAPFNDCLTEMGRPSVESIDVDSLLDILDEREQHEIACRFAEHVLHLFENKHPDDDRPRKAITAKRGWLVGDVNDNELAAARSAAWASWSAARSDAMAARSAARSDAMAAWSAAWSAARDAARAAARAAWSAAMTAASADGTEAWEAEHRWQIAEICRLISE